MFQQPRVYSFKKNDFSSFNWFLPKDLYEFSEDFVNSSD